MLQEDSFSSQEADYKSETQLKPRRPTDILQKPHPDLEFYLYVLEIHEQMFFRKLASKGCFLKKKKKNQKKKKHKTRTKTKTEKQQQQQQQQQKQQQQQQQQTITKKSKQKVSCDF